MVEYTRTPTRMWKIVECAAVIEEGVDLDCKRWKKLRTLMS